MKSEKLYFNFFQIVLSAHLPYCRSTTSTPGYLLLSVQNKHLLKGALVFILFTVYSDILPVLSTLFETVNRLASFIYKNVRWETAWFYQPVSISISCTVCCSLFIAIQFVQKILIVRVVKQFLRGNGSGLGSTLVTVTSLDDFVVGQTVLLPSQ